MVWHPMLADPWPNLLAAVLCAGHDDRPLTRVTAVSAPREPRQSRTNAPALRSARKEVSSGAEHGSVTNDLRHSVLLPAQAYGN